MKKVALLGFGNIGKKIFYKSLTQKNILISKILKKTLHKSRLLNVKFFTNFKTFVKSDNFDGYIIATPVDSHYDYAKKIIKKKKCFIIEKPLVSKIRDLEKLNKVCKYYKHSIFVNHLDLYNPAFIKFLKILKLVGEYKKINISFGKFQKIKKFDYINDKKKNLPSFDWMPHPIAIALKLAGIPKKIEIIKNNVSIKKKYLIQKSNINLHCKDKVVNINFSNSYIIPKKRVVIKGSKATLVYDGYKKTIFIKKKNVKYFKKFFHSKVDSLENLLKLFYLAMEKRYYRNDIHLSYKIMKILFQIENKMKKKLKLKKVKYNIVI